MSDLVAELHVNHSKPQHKVDTSSKSHSNPCVRLTCTLASLGTSLRLNGAKWPHSPKELGRFRAISHSAALLLST